jgi:hypothetical protein
MRVNRDSIAAILAIAGFAIVVSLGFWKTRGPSTQRLARADEKRVQNLSQLASEINMQYLQQNKQLAERLTDAQKTKFADPVSNKPLAYVPKPPGNYSLCTTFSIDSPKEESNRNFDFWMHPAGAKCFEFNAAEQVPQAPYFYY